MNAIVWAIRQVSGSVFNGLFLLAKESHGSAGRKRGPGLLRRERKLLFFPSSADMPPVGKCRCTEGVQRTDPLCPVELTDLSIALSIAFFILYVSW